MKTLEERIKLCLDSLKQQPLAIKDRMIRLNPKESCAQSIDVCSTVNQFRIRVPNPNCHLGCGSRKNDETCDLYFSYKEFQNFMREHILEYPDQIKRAVIEGLCYEDTPLLYYMGTFGVLVFTNQK